MAFRGYAFDGEQLTVYTVVRFEASRGKIKKLVALAHSLERIEKGLFEGLDKVPGRFSCSICSDDRWVKHTKAMSRFLIKYSSIVRKARRFGIKVEFDVAIEPEDLAKRSYTYRCAAAKRPHSNAYARKG